MKISRSKLFALGIIFLFFVIILSNVVTIKTTETALPTLEQNRNIKDTLQTEADVFDNIREGNKKSNQNDLIKKEVEKMLKEIEQERRDINHLQEDRRLNQRNSSKRRPSFTEVEGNPKSIEELISNNGPSPYDDLLISPTSTEVVN